MITVMTFRHKKTRKPFEGLSGLPAPMSGSSRGLNVVGEGFEPTYSYYLNYTTALGYRSLQHEAFTSYATPQYNHRLWFTDGACVSKSR
jgi:hypothetical protein